MMVRLALFITGLALGCGSAVPVQAQVPQTIVKCVIQRLKLSNQAVSNNAQLLMVRDLVLEIARTGGISAEPVVVPCENLGTKAEVWPFRDIASVPDNDYIVYQPRWVREVTGYKRTQLIALLGHEIGHITNQHTTTRAHIPRAQQEEEADKFAGCAVGRLTKDFGSLEDLFSRLRDEVETGDHPGRLKSLAVAKVGMRNCTGRPDSPNVGTLTIQSGQLGKDIFHADLKNDVARKLSTNAEVAEYVRIQWLQPGSVVPPSGVLAAVRHGVLDATMVKADARPRVIDLDVVSCGTGNWLIANRVRWRTLHNTATAAIARVCSAME